jgi:CRP-like cAMP-binding protein
MRRALQLVVKMFTQMSISKRQRQSAVMAAAVLIMFREMCNVYRPREKNMGRKIQELFVLLAIRLQDGSRRSKPLSTRQISRMTNLPRSNVQRVLLRLVRERLIVKTDEGYEGDGNYLLANLEARYHRRIMGTFLGAANQLRRLQKKD